MRTKLLLLFLACTVASSCGQPNFEAICFKSLHNGNDPLRRVPLSDAKKAEICSCMNERLVIYEKEDGKKVDLKVEYIKMLKQSDQTDLLAPLQIASIVYQCGVISSMK